MLRVSFSLFFCLLIISDLYALQSTITESEGYSCMGEDKSKKQTEQTAMADAKKKAIEKISTYIQSETQVKDFELQKDIVSAYANANVKIIQELGKGWYKDQTMGDCYKINIKAEVIPDEKAMKQISEKQTSDDPTAPLKVNVWTDKKEYKNSEKIKVYIKGNKPFFARVVYKDTSGDLMQLLPNPYRSDYYFNGGIVYEIPSGNDRFELEVSPPFGNENVIVYASTSPLGSIELDANDSVYQVVTKPKDVGEKTRGVKLTEKKSDEGTAASEFSEETVIIKTGK